MSETDRPMRQTFTSEDYKRALRIFRALDGSGLSFSVYYAAEDALRIAANIMKPGLLEEALIDGGILSFGEGLIDTHEISKEIRAALTKEQP